MNGQQKLADLILILVFYPVCFVFETYRGLVSGSGPPFGIRISEQPVVACSLTGWERLSGVKKRPRGYVRAGNGVVDEESDN